MLIDFTGTIYSVECISSPVTIKYQQGSDILLFNANTPLLAENFSDLSHSHTPCNNHWTLWTFITSVSERQSLKSLKPWESVLLQGWFCICWTQKQYYPLKVMLMKNVVNISMCQHFFSFSSLSKKWMPLFPVHLLWLVDCVMWLLYDSIPI